jgi:hypothetical protein
MDRKARVDQLRRGGAGAGGIERGMLEEPDQLGSAPVRNRRGAHVHGGERRLVGQGAVVDAPLDRRYSRRRLEPDRQTLARASHR